MSNYKAWSFCKQSMATTNHSSIVFELLMTFFKNLDDLFTVAQQLSASNLTGATRFKRVPQVVRKN